MNDVIKSDFQRICEIAYRSRTIEQAEIPLFYVFLMCEQLGFENDYLSLENGHPAIKEKVMQPLHEAIWTGVATALWASPCRIRAFTPSPVYSYGGRLLKVEMRGIMHDRYFCGSVDFDIASLLAYVVNIHNMDGFHDIQPTFI